MLINYQTSVLVPAGWRSVEITAHAERKSEKMVIVSEVLAIDGEAPIGYTSRTGAKRQTYHAHGIALREVGKVKRLSACCICKEA